MLKFNTFFKSFRFKSIFIRTFMTLVLLSLLLVAVFSYFSIKMVADYYTKQADDSNLAMLNQSDNTMKLTLSTMSQNMIQFMWNPDIVTRMVNPYGNDSQIDSKILQFLKSGAMTNNLITFSYFYLPMADKLYTSYGTILVFSDMAADNPIVNILNDEFPGKPVEKEDLLYIRYINGKLYAIQEFPAISIAGSHRNRIGIYVQQFNMNALYSLICGTKAANEEGEYTYVFDKAGNNIFSGVSFLPKSPNFDLSDSGAFLTPGSNNRENKKYYFVNSSSLEWDYIRQIQTGGINFTDYIPVALPSLIVLLIISIAFSIYLSIHIYKPINRLMATVVSSRHKGMTLMNSKGDAKNEADYLEMAYTDALDKSGRLSGLMNIIAPAVIEQLLRCLIFGRELDDRYISDTLSGIGDPIKENDYYLVMVGSTGESEDITLTGVESSLYYISIKNIVSAINESDYKAFIVPNARYTATIVICFSKDNEDEIKKSALSAFNYIENKMHGMPFSFYLAKGQIYKDIKNLTYSFQEAQTALSYRMYYDKSQKDSDSVSEEVSTSFTLSEQMKDIVTKASQGHLNEAIESAGWLVESIAGMKNGNAGLTEKMFGMLINEIMEKLIAFHIGTEDLSELSEKQSELDFTKFAGVDDMRNAAMEFLHGAVTLLNLYSKKNQYKYVAKAKEYIESNYMDSSLSLNMISGNIGINSSYLSELFSEVTGEYYLNYLNTFRVEKAKQMLESTRLTIKDIGFKCGFNSIQNFIRVFKRVAQMTPGQYREIKNH